MVISRRALLAAAAFPPSLCTAPRPGLHAIRSTNRDELVVFVNVVGSARNWYDAWSVKGGQSAADAYKSQYKILESEGNLSTAGLALLARTIAETKGGMVLNVTAPSSKGDLLNLIKLCSDHQIYFVTQNNLPPADIRPWDFNPYYVAHIEFDHRLAAFKVARQLIAAMGERGGVVALSGKSGDAAASHRMSGLEAALEGFPKCYLLDSADAEWEAPVAYDITRSMIARYGTDAVAGVWAANDDMALGAVEAFRIYRRPVPVTGMDGSPPAIEALRVGTLAATVAWDAFWEGGISLSLALGARSRLFHPATEPHAHRAFYGPFDVITPENVREFADSRSGDHTAADWKDFWGRSRGEIPNA